VPVVGETPVVPAYGELVVTAEGRRFDSPIGAEGEFYLDNVSIGRHPAVIKHRARRCSCSASAPHTPTRPSR
jgi:outer membrane usher protein